MTSGQGRHCTLEVRANGPDLAYRSMNSWLNVHPLAKTGPSRDFDEQQPPPLRSHSPSEDSNADQAGSMAARASRSASSAPVREPFRLMVPVNMCRINLPI
jgi:hypothetical protein